MQLKEFFRQLKRRNVFKVAGVYAISGWLLIQVATSVFPVLLLPSWLTRAVVVLILIGFPIAVIIAWAFEITPEGVKRTDEVEIEKSITQKTGKKLNNIFMVILFLAVMALSYKVFFEHRPITKQSNSQLSVNTDSLSLASKSIAVLPFVNESKDSSDQYFSDGLAEELIIALNQYPDLKVIGRESSFQFRGKNLNSKVIGKKLDVAHLLEGSVSRQGNEVRVRAELVNTADGSMDWSHHYDRPYKDLFQLQDEITHSVSSALQAQLTKSLQGNNVKQTERPPSGNLAAYNAYLQGKFYFNRFNKTSLHKAIHYFQKAVKLDPEYVDAYARLSATWTVIGGSFGNKSNKKVQQAYEHARAAAKKAISINPNSALAHAVMGLFFRFNCDWKEMEKEFRRAIQLTPNNATIKTHMALAQATLGHPQKAIRLEKQALAPNPLDALGYRLLSSYLKGTGNFVKAELAIKKSISIQPDASHLYSQLAEIEILRGNTSAALQAAKKEKGPFWRRYAIALVYAATNKQAKADSALHSLITNDATHGAYQIAEVYAQRRQPEKVFTWLNRAWKYRDPGIGEILYDPLLLSYRHDPRYIEYCHKVGLPIPNGDQQKSSSLAG